MDANQEATVASQNIRHFTELQCRRRCPKVNTDMLEKFLDNTEADYLRFWTEQYMNVKCIPGIPFRPAVSMESKHQRTKSSINFFNLPAELRNQIYELALVNTYMGTDLEGDESRELHISSYWYKRPGLLSSSQRVRNEVLPMYYATPLRWFTTAKTNPPDLTAPTHSLNERKLDSYLCAIGPRQASMIKQIKIVFDCSYLPQNRDRDEGTELEFLVSLENLADQDVVEQILMAYGLLCYGVPREAWRIEKGEAFEADGTISSAAPRPFAQPDSTPTSSSLDDSPGAMREAQLRQAPLSCVSKSVMAPARNLPWGVAIETVRIPRRRNGRHPS